MKRISWLTALLLLCGTVCGADFTHSSKVPCGVAVLKVCSEILKRKISLENIRSHLVLDENNECSFKELKAAATQLGMSVAGMEMSPAELRELKYPAIAHLKVSETNTHFIVVVEVRGQNALVVDGSQVQWVSLKDFLRVWTGRVLVLSNEEVRVDTHQNEHRLAEIVETSTILKADKTLHQFERTPEGNLACVFTLHNVSTNIVEIADLKPCCNSEAKVMGEKTIKPGDSTQVRLSTPFSNGPLQRDLVVFLKDISANPIPLRATYGKDVAYYTATPNILASNGVIRGMEANASTTLTFTSNTNITGIESPEDIHVKAIKMSGKQYRIEAKIETSSFRQERVIEWIRIHSSLENGVTCADINLQVTCPILPALKATPERIFLGELKVNAHSQAEVVVSALNQRSFWISQARCKGTESTVDWDRGLWESSHKLRVKCLARTPGPASDSIRIETDGDIKAELEVHVYWITKE